MAQRQKAKDLYKTLSPDEQSMVDEMIYGRPAVMEPVIKASAVPHHRLKKGGHSQSSLEEEKTDSETNSSPSSVNGSCISAEESVGESKEEDEEEEELKSPPVPLEQDYDMLIELVRDIPSIFLDEHDEFASDDPLAFKPYAVEMAMERLGWRWDEVEGYPRGGFMGSVMDKNHGRQSMTTNSSLNTAKQNAKQVYRQKKDKADSSRFKRYLKVLSQTDPPPQTAKAYKAMRSLLLSIMSNDSEERDSVCILRGVDILVDFMNTDPHIKVLEMAIPVLGCLADNHKDRQSLLAEHFAVTRTLVCLRRPNNSKLLEEECVIALYKLTKDHVENTRQFAHAWGVSTLLDIMDRRQKNLVIQKHAIGILLHTSQVVVEYVLSNARLFRILSTILTRHRSSIPLESVGLVLLRRLAFVGNDAALDDMLRNNVVSTAILVMLSHPNYAPIVHRGFGVLNILCHYRYKARLTVASAESLTELVRMTKTHQHDVFVQRESFKMLRTLKDVPYEHFHVSSSLLKDTHLAGILGRAGLMEKVQKRQDQSNQENASSSSRRN